MEAAFEAVKEARRRLAAAVRAGNDLAEMIFATGELERALRRLGEEAEIAYRPGRR